MSTNDEIVYLINPKSNEGNAMKLWRKMIKQYDLLQKEPLDTTRISLEKEVKKRQPKLIVIAGGDGTINAVCSLLCTMEKKPCLAILPFGFGNALSYCFGVESMEKAI